jgi:hypothetical protein
VAVVANQPATSSPGRGKKKARGKEREKKRIDMWKEYALLQF